MSCSEYSKTLRKAQKENRSLLRRIRTAYEVGNRRSLRGLIDLYLKCHSSKFCALHYAFKRKRKADKRPSLNRMTELAHDLDLLSECNEPVYVNGKSKKNGGIRKTLNFGPINMARQVMVAEILKQIFNFPSYMTNAPGNGGRNLAVNQIVNHIHEGEAFLVIADIANCFGSFSAGEIAESLPLPRKVIDNCILSNGLNIVGDDMKPSHRRGYYLRHNNNIHTHPLRARPAGLPQGSVASPLVSLMLLSRRTEVMPFLHKLVLYGDDICVAAETRKEAYAIRKTLRSSFTEHPAGRLEFRKLEFHTARVGINFLGYQISGNQQFVKAVPLPKTVENFKTEMRTAFREDRQAKHTTLIHTKKCADQWLNGFPSSDAKLIAEKELEKYFWLLTNPIKHIDKRPFTSIYKIPSLVP